jgi:putative YhbY family RNA-binding protein
MNSLNLTPAQRKALRAQAHHLDPVVTIGAEGLSPGVLKEADSALAAHGLIKLRMFSDVREQRETALRELADQLGAAAVQHIGKLLVLWRPKADVRQPPASAGAAPRVVKILKFPKSGNHRPQIQKVTVYGNQRVTAGGTIKRAKSRPVSRKKQALD